MADQKVTALTEKTAPADTDVMYLVDDPAGSPASKKVTVARFILRALVTTLGDLIVATASATLARLPVGVDGEIIRADSSQSTGLNWEPSLGYYGSGNDGAMTLNGSNTYPTAMTLSGSTYTLTRDIHCSSLTIATGQILITAGYRVYCTGLVDVQGTGIIHNDGGDAATTTAGAGGLGDTAIGTRTHPFYGGGVGAAVPGASTAGVDGGGPLGLASTVIAHAMGGLGGGGGPAPLATATIGLTCGTGQPGVAPALPSGRFRALHCLDAALRASLVNVTAGGAYSNVHFGGGVGGGSGGRGSAGNAGAGGGGGGVLFIACKVLKVAASARVSANGGIGGAATTGSSVNNGGGGGGGGGIVILQYALKQNSGTISANGGAGGASVNNGTVQCPMKSIVTTNNATSATRYVVDADATTAATRMCLNRLYLVCVHNTKASTPDTPTLSGWGLTWTQVATVTFNTVASPTRRMTLFSAYGTPDIDSLADGLTVDFGANTQTGCSVTVDRMDGGSVVNASATANGNAGTAAPVTLTIGANNGTYCVHGRSAGTAPTVGTNMTALTTQATAPLLFSEGRQGGQTNPTSTWTTSADWGAIAAEITSATTNGSAGTSGRVIEVVV